MGIFTSMPLAVRMLRLSIRRMRAGGYGDRRRSRLQQIAFST